MLPPPAHRPTHLQPPCAAGLQVAAAWLALLLLVQGFQVALLRGAGPLHHHQALAMAGDAGHAHAHADAQRHHHAEALAGLQLDATDANADAQGHMAQAQALVAALALLACGHALRLRGGPARHVLNGPLLRPWRSQRTAPPLRPPRPA